MLHIFLFIYLVKHILYFYIKNICCAADDNVYIVLCKETGVTSLVYYVTVDIKYNYMTALKRIRVMVMVFSATFNTISTISWR